MNTATALAELATARKALAAAEKAAREAIKKEAATLAKAHGAKFLNITTDEENEGVFITFDTDNLTDREYNAFEKACIKTLKVEELDSGNGFRPW